MTGAEYIAEFLHQRGSDKVFLVTGGACAFAVDAIARHPKMQYVCFQHEQAAAMAADAVWRVSRRVGVTIATSGPGATNLITGIACSYFDSIPSIHITGQVNKKETATYFGAKVRQAGFQETNIVEMVKPITKYAVQVNSVGKLKKELVKAYNIAVSGRMGPVLIDVPMNVQKSEVGSQVEYPKSKSSKLTPQKIKLFQKRFSSFLKGAGRPLVLIGAGVGSAGVEKEVAEWLEVKEIPFVSSWGGLSCFDHSSNLYCGNIGVYGNRGANYILQNCEALLVLGSRLDNRQRSGDVKSFAKHARVLVVDIDGEELKKYKPLGYYSAELDLHHLPKILRKVSVRSSNLGWLSYISEIKAKYFGKPVDIRNQPKGLSPFSVIDKINHLIRRDAIVVVDTGANLCWVYQYFYRTKQTLFTAGGNSPMGYSLPAAIGAALQGTRKQIVCFVGDGGFQMNIQELQTIVHYGLDIKIVLMNNNGYGIIKQFQDSYLGHRYEATGKGYGAPNFRSVVKAYKIRYLRINRIEQLTSKLFAEQGSIVMDVIFDPNTITAPKLEMGHPLHDQFPYVSDLEFNWANRFNLLERPSRL